MSEWRGPDLWTDELWGHKLSTVLLVNRHKAERVIRQAMEQVREWAAVECEVQAKAREDAALEAGISPEDAEADRAAAIAIDETARRIRALNLDTGEVTT